MRSRPFAVIVAALIASLASSRAQAQGSSDHLADGLIPGDYLRVAFISSNPINPQGSLRDWNRGQGISLVWENWDHGPSGVSRLGFGLEGSYSLYPLDDQAFIADFTNGPNGLLRTATGTKASILQFGVTTKIRIPTPYIMPTIGVAFGFLDWRPGQIRYTSINGTTGTAKQGHRSGGALSFTGGLDKHIVDRFAIFADASYTYAYTSFGAGLGASGSSCLTANCDLLKNTQLGVFRGGLRVRVGR